MRNHRAFFSGPRGLAVLTTFFLLGACGGETNDLAAPSSCTPGQVVACPCGGGQGEGTQTCQEDGKHFSPCSCDGAGGSGGAATGGTGGGGTGGAGTGGGSTGGGGGTGATAGSGGASGSSCDTPPPAIDMDGDGWTAMTGDCDECNAEVNPGAYDFVGNALDDDCSGGVDDPVVRCDSGLPEAAGDELTDAANAAKALGLCQTTKITTPVEHAWGVISAAYVFPDGSTKSATPQSTLGTCTGTGGEGGPPNPLSHGVLPSFGGANTPLEGDRFVVLSSGVARPGVQGDSPGGASMCTASQTPPGFPKTELAACPGMTFDNTPEANDPIALELKILTPTNAHGFSFALNFHTYEYPVYVCTEYFDTFVALLDGPGAQGVPPDHNILLTQAGDQLTAASSQLMAVCEPGSHGGVDFSCPRGSSALAGTGFDEHAATGWLRTTAPVLPGQEITIRLAIWDAGDEVLDSTVLLDDFRWYQETPELATSPEAN